MSSQAPHVDLKNLEIPYFINPKVLPKILSQVLDSHITCALLLNTSGSILSSVSNDGSNAGSGPDMDTKSKIHTSSSGSRLKNLARSLPRSNIEENAEYGLSSSQNQQSPSQRKAHTSIQPTSIQPGLLSAILSNIWMLYDKSVKRVHWNSDIQSPRSSIENEEVEDNFSDYQDEQTNNQATHRLNALIIENDFGKIAVERISKKLIISVCGDEFIEVGLLRHKVKQLKEYFEKPLEQVKYDELME